jgi:hypothetical protein
MTNGQLNRAHVKKETGMQARLSWSIQVTDSRFHTSLLQEHGVGQDTTRGFLLGEMGMDMVEHDNHASLAHDNCVRFPLSANRYTKSVSLVPPC